MEKKASYERAQEKLHKLQNALMMLNKTMVIRNKWYSLIEKHWAHQLEVAFASLMGNRGFEVPKQLHRKLKNEEAVDDKKEENFLKSVEGFYKAGISYLKLWENSFDKANHFKWLTLQHDPTWDEMEDSALTVASVIPDSINVDELFDERSSLIQILKNMKPEWDSLPKDETPKTQEKWKQVFEAFSRSNVSFVNIFKIVEFAMCLPGTSAPAERIFSMMGSVWTAERGRLSLSVVRDLLYIKANSVMTCSEFHDHIKNDKSFLRKGVITIDFERETLTMKVAPGNKQAVQATESLSGGERSFSTVSFIMALWNIVQPPFYFLDEFDVFMDKVNRQIVLESLLSHAKESNAQFVFLTPLDTSIKPNHQTKVLKNYSLTFMRDGRTASASRLKQCICSNLIFTSSVTCFVFLFTVTSLVGNCWCDGERDCAIMGRAHSSLFSSLIIRDSWSLSLLVPGVTRF
ncbi:unnamed protein product, partial [Timema podura]|nr:unnamed protein product [Timema podura]